MKKLLSIPEAAELLGCSVHKIYRLTASKEIPHYKIGQQVRFDEDHLSAWLETCAVSPEGK